MDGSNVKSAELRGFLDLGGDAGLSKATTVALFKTIRDSVIPELTHSHVADPKRRLPVRTKLAPPITAREIRYLLNLMVGQQSDLALQYLCQQRSRGISAPTLALDLIGGTAVHLQNCWAHDTLTFPEITAVCGRLADLLSQLDTLIQFDNTPVLFDQTKATVVRPRILMAGTPGTQHTLGQRIVDFILRSNGFDCRVLSPQNEAALALQMSSQQVDVIGFSVGWDGQIPDTRRYIEMARAVSFNKHVTILLGGALMVHRPELGKALGADIVCAGAATLPAQLSRFFGLTPLSAALEVEK